MCRRLPRPVDEDFLFGLDPAFVVQAQQGGDSRHRHRRRLLVRQVLRFRRQFAFLNAYVLGEAALLEQREHLVAGRRLELGTWPLRPRGRQPPLRAARHGIT